MTAPGKGNLVRSQDKTKYSCQVPSPCGNSTSWPWFGKNKLNDEPRINRISLGYKYDYNLVSWLEDSLQRNHINTRDVFIFSPLTLEKTDKVLLVLLLACHHKCFRIAVSIRSTQHSIAFLPFFLTWPATVRLWKTVCFIHRSLLSSGIGSRI